MPVFFGTAGLSADLTVLGDPTLLLVALALVLIASIGKFAGAFLGGTLAALPARESLALACGMNARGSTEVVIATIGLSMGALSHTLYSMIVAMAVITTTAMPPMLRWALGRLTMAPEERDRLAREELEAQGFLAKLERLLVAADQSPSGQLASRLAGILSMARRMPLTVLEMKGAPPTASAPDPVALADVARGAANDAAGAENAVPAAPDVTARQRDGTPQAAVSDEARKGYDLLFVGLDNGRMGEEGAQGQLPQLATSFAGPVCVVQARTPARTVYMADPAKAELDMLVPVSGTVESRRAMEIAVALAQAGGRAITLLYVEPPVAGPGGYTLQRGLLGTQGMELREAAHFAEQLNIHTRMVIRSAVSIEDAIVAQIRRGRHNLVLLGVRPRSSDTRFYGIVAAEVLGRAECSVMLVSG